MITSETSVLPMVEAVFFDWFNTLADFKPSRQEMYQQAFQNLGIALSTKDVMRGILRADQHYFEENDRPRMHSRSHQEQMEVYLCYPWMILDEAGTECPPELIWKVLNIVIEQLKKGSTFVLFNDVLSALTTLKQRNLILGLLTNATKDAISRFRYFGLEPHINLVVTPEEVGASKPEPAIFQSALDRAGVEAAEAIHVGDQYALDVVGARRAGISPILIDRFDLYPEVTDCPRIQCLAELTEYL